MKDEILSATKSATKKSDNYLQSDLNELITLSEAVQIEFYDSRNNIRVLGVPEILEGDLKNEMVESTMAKSETSGEKRTVVDFRDVSNSRLPSNSPIGKPLNVRFERRIAKFNNLGGKNFRSSENHLKIVIIFEDLSRPRVNLKKLVKRDTRISSILTTEESILCIWREDGQPNRVNLLYEGGQFP